MYFPKCNFDTKGNPAPKGTIPRAICTDEFKTLSGGNTEHIMTDVHIMTQPIEMLEMAYQRDQTMSPFGIPLIHGKQTYDYDFGSPKAPDVATLRRFELPSKGQNNAPILDESHFGWKIADCTECHDDTRQPLGHGGHSWPINSADGFDVTQPYFCASCHGNNGAPVAHKTETRCFMCHSRDN